MHFYFCNLNYIDSQYQQSIAALMSRRERPDGSGSALQPLFTGMHVCPKCEKFDRFVRRGTPGASVILMATNSGRVDSP